MTHAITIELPETVYSQLTQAAQLFQQPVEKIVEQSLTHSLPPLLEDIPAEYQAEVFPLLAMSDAELLAEAQQVFDPDRWGEYEALLAKKKKVALGDQEQVRLDVLRQQADILTLRKGYAMVLLKRRGYQLPTRNQLPVSLRMNKRKRQRVSKQAAFRCGYCHPQEVISGIPLTVEHIKPKARGGSDDEQNLWLSCRLCNEAKGVLVEAKDPYTASLVLLFNPRTPIWSEHFAWSDDGTRIIGLTPIGRATVEALSLNSDFRVRSRKIWVEAGYHPPD